jgi:hypothetical protein
LLLGGNQPDVPVAYLSVPVSGPGPAGPANSIWVTGDGGASWTQQPIPPGAGCIEGDRGNLLYPLSLSPDAGVCPTSARCYSVSGTSPFDPATGVNWPADGGEL